MIKLMPLLLLLILFSACSETKKQQEVLAESTSEVKKKESEEPIVNASIPSYNFDALEKEFIQQTDDQVYVLNFWATWCKPCIKELPAFEELNATYSDQNVKVVLVSLDFPEKWESAVVPFMEKQGSKSEVILLDDSDANTWINKVSEKWSGAIPATLMVKNGERQFYERSFTFSELETELKTIL